MRYSVKVLESNNEHTRLAIYKVDAGSIQYHGPFIVFVGAGGTENAVFSANSVLSVTRE